MSGCTRRPGEGAGDHAHFLKSAPAVINQVVLTGRLSAEPQPARGPTGERVTLLWIEFPVAHPDHPRALWTWASCLVEVSRDCPPGEIEHLHGGASVLAAGQLSDRWTIEDGHTSRRGVIVASLLHPGPSPGHPGELFVAGG